jgi:hypothetical protein
MKQSFQHGFPLFKSEAENHEQHKVKILTDVSAIPRHSIREKGIRLTSCDWGMDKNISRHYWDAGYLAVENFIKQVCDLLGFSNWSVLERWFQYYEQGDYHAWHIHGNAMFVGVYYVKLEDTNAVITFKWREQDVEVPVSEGDVLMFPSYLWHKAKKTMGESKLILSFNCNFSVGQDAERVFNKV